MQIAKQVFLRHLYIVEKQLGRVLAFQPHFPEIFAALEALHASFDDEQAKAVFFPGVCARDDDNQVSQYAIGNKRLRAIQQEMVPLVLGSGSNSRDIAAGPGLGNRDCQYVFSTHALWQPAPFLLVSAKFTDIGRHQSAV